MLDLISYYKLLLGETNIITNRVGDISWTSDDAKDMVVDVIRQWSRFDVNEHDAATGISTCKAYLNGLLRGLDKELTANQGWAVGQGLLSSLNSLFDSGFNRFASGLTGTVSELYANRAKTVQGLMNDIKRILNKY